MIKRPHSSKDFSIFHFPKSREEDFYKLTEYLIPSTKWDAEYLIG